VTIEKPKRKGSAMLNPRQEAFVEAIMENHNPAAAAEIAGIQNGSAVLRSEKVRTEIAVARAEISNLTTLKRLDIVSGIMDGIGVARMTSDGGNMIRGWVEIGKFLGLAVPEVKKIELTINQARLRSHYEALSDEDLLRIAEGNVIEGEAVREL